MKPPKISKIPISKIPISNNDLIYDFYFKVIVVGDSGVGKNTLTSQFCKAFFSEDYRMTIGMNFHVKTISIDTEEDGILKVKLQVWSIGDQERFSSFRPMYYRGSLGGLILFDLTSYESFKRLPQWIEEVRANMKTEIPLLLVGNKSDRIKKRAISSKEISYFAKKYNLYYVETSAKTGKGVEECFSTIATLMCEGDMGKENIEESKKVIEKVIEIEKIKANLTKSKVDLARLEKLQYEMEQFLKNYQKEEEEK